MPSLAEASMRVLHSGFPVRHQTNRLTALPPYRLTALPPFRRSAEHES
jgi:hypothetical protein